MCSSEVQRAHFQTLPSSSHLQLSWSGSSCPYQGAGHNSHVLSGRLGASSPLTRGSSTAQGSPTGNADCGSRESFISLIRTLESVHLIFYRNSLLIGHAFPANDINTILIGLCCFITQCAFDWGWKTCDITVSCHEYSSVTVPTCLFGLFLYPQS